MFEYKQTYKGYIIFKGNRFGLYQAYLEFDGLFAVADTLAGIKKMITEDIQNAKNERAK